jgi:dephospho-CoA kinase
MRTLIIGAPKTGKTTMANEAFSGIPIYHTDDLIKLGWSEASEAVARWMEREGPWCIEGVAIPRALRKWFATHPNKEDTPCDTIFVLTEPHIELTSQQQNMAAGMLTVWREMVPQLKARGVEIVVR